jgi:hypothetical protein
MRFIVFNEISQVRVKATYRHITGESSMTENTSTQHSRNWNEIATPWRDPFLLKDARDQKKAPGFPYSGGYLRNLCTGSNPDPYLSKHVFRIGKHPAIRKAALVEWLNARTRS